MKQQAFMSQLESSLAGLAQADVEQILADYAEYFRAAAQLGHSEDDTAAGLGDPKRIGRDLRVQKLYGQWQQKHTIGGLVRTVVAIARLGALNFLLAIPFMIYLTVLTAGIFISSAVVAGALVALIAVGAHALFGAPTVKLTDATGGTGDLKVVALQQGAPRKDLYRFRNDDVEVQLQSGDQVELTERSGKVTHLLARDGELVTADTPPASLDHGYRIAQGNLQSVSVKSTDGENVVWSQDSKLGRIDWYALNHNGIDATIVTPRTGADHVAITINDGQIQVRVPAGHHQTAHVLRASVGVLLIAALVLFVLIKLAVMTWRGVVRYGRDQIAQIPLHLVF
ncbi:DUF1700 domain-containing protein [Silvimonas iriomotensis]|uniref:DUF1700 domain-containing protein n=1 Tax=Silvimonas iriomotensis TaxID=449662 RepID=A0ABQ2PEV0_9NEIS|nr:DUF1700 domain-containing protein [Silvimonas iriomotensis]GGP24087.1 hypothetical protein GCM10010970_40870 [Silvimonas iriomotensis]